VNNEQIKNNAGEFGAGDERVAGLLSAMKRVEAPKDFDFKVRARIAAGRPATQPSLGIPVAVRYAVPLVLLVLIGAYFGFNAFYANKQVNVPAVAESAPPVAAPVAESPSNNIIVPTANPIKEEHASVKKSESLNTSGSDTRVIKKSNFEPQSAPPLIQMGRQQKTLSPRGFNMNPGPSANTKMPDSPAQISASPAGRSIPLGPTRSPDALASRLVM
jgi:hypothetical protein